MRRHFWGMQQLLDFFDRLSDQAPRFALPKLALELDYRSIGPVEAPGQDRGDVKGDDRIDCQQCRRIGDVELRGFQAPYVRRVGLIQEHGHFAEYGARRGDFGDLNAILEDLDGTGPEHE